MAKKKKRLSHKERRFVKALAKGATQVDAAIVAGYSPKNPKQSGHQAMEAIRAKMSDVLDRHGLTDDVLIDQHLLPLLGAKMVKAFSHSKRGVVYSKPLVDNDIRLRTLDITFKLKGAYSPKTEEEARINQQFTGPTVIVLDLPRPPRQVQEETKQ